VSLGAETSGIDFAVEAGGEITGVIVDESSGAPLPSIRVKLSDEEGRYLRYTWTDSGGTYSFRALAMGSYFVYTDDYDGYVNEVYDDVTCIGSCDPTAGTPIVVRAATTSSGIDFALAERPFGQISGRVTDAVTGQGLNGLQVTVWSTSGDSVRWATTDSAGHYTVTDLGAATWFVSVDAPADRLDELYRDILCPLGISHYGSGCDPTTGTPVPVSLGAETTGIDFALDRFGTISGTVTDADTGSLLAGVWIDLRNARGQQVAYVKTDAAGRYLAEGLGSGAHYLATAAPGEDYLDEIYNDLPCLGSVGSAGCLISKGNPVEVVAGSTLRGIDFALRPLTTGIVGQVTAAATGQGIPNVAVDLWDASGTRRATGLTDSGGYYVADVPPGIYYLSTHTAGGFVEELYDGIGCPAGSAFDGSCDPTGGTPVVVPVPAGVGSSIVGGIDFTLVTRVPGDPSTLFTDDFESGNLSAWSLVQP